MKPSHRAATHEPEPYGRAASEPHEPGHIRCEVCGQDVYYICVPGRQRKTCGSRKCIRKYRHQHGIGNAICAQVQGRGKHG